MRAVSLFIVSSPLAFKLNVISLVKKSSGKRICREAIIRSVYWKTLAGNYWVSSAALSPNVTINEDDPD
jgi:hypothetical protein